MKHKLTDRPFSRKHRSAEDQNPMEGVANMADAMLVLAVGIMLALVANWNVDLSNAPAAATATPAPTIMAAPLDENDLIAVNADDIANWENFGTIYYDSETQQFYVVKDPNAHLPSSATPDPFGNVQWDETATPMTTFDEGLG